METESLRLLSSQMSLVRSYRWRAMADPRKERKPAPPFGSSPEKIPEKARACFPLHQVEGPAEFLRHLKTNFEGLIEQFIDYQPTKPQDAKGAPFYESRTTT